MTSSMKLRETGPVVLLVEILVLLLTGPQLSHARESLMFLLSVNILLVRFLSQLESLGYPCEEHNVTTSDGYILTIHRIPNKDKPPVLLQHGLFGKSDMWIGTDFTNTENIFAFMLWSAGYDVWLGNIRGNGYGRHHVKLDPKGSEFWEFSFHEVGLYDVSATIDYILSTTRVEKLNYVGHSLGVNLILVLLSERPEYNNKINQLHAWAPGVYIGTPPNFITKILKDFSVKIATELLRNNRHEIEPVSDILQPYANTCEKMFIMPLCSEVWSSVFTESLITTESETRLLEYRWFSIVPVLQLLPILLRICDALGIVLLCLTMWFRPFSFRSLDEKSTKSVIPEVADMKIANYLSPTSLKLVRHLIQNVGTGTCRQFFDGDDAALMEGKQQEKLPPEYDFSKVTATILFQYSKDDFLTTNYSMTLLCSNVANCCKVGEVSSDKEKFSHLDFIFGSTSAALNLYNNTLHIMKHGIQGG